MATTAKEITELMEEILKDNAVPRNIRRAVEDARNKVAEKADATNLSMAIYQLDDVSNDINMPSHTRTEIWSLISKLEELKEKVKK